MRQPRPFAETTMVVFHRDPLGIASFLFVYVLLFFGDYVAIHYVVEYGQHDSLLRTVCALIIHILMLMAVLSHLRASFSDPGYVPLSTTKIDFSSDLEKSDPNQKTKKSKETAAISEWTVCTKCEVYRPPRAHHCRTCSRCVRRMDHHCPWINNCVGELNFKYFFLFLMYTGLLCLFGLILIISDWIVHWNDDTETSLDKVLSVILFFEALLFLVFVSVMGTGMIMAVLFDRHIIEIKRYGPATGQPQAPRTVLMNAVFGRGYKVCWLLPCVKPRIPNPVPPSKKAMMTV